MFLDYSDFRQPSTSFLQFHLYYFLVILVYVVYFSGSMPGNDRVRLSKIDKFNLHKSD